MMVSTTEHIQHVLTKFIIFFLFTAARLSVLMWRTAKEWIPQNVVKIKLTVMQKLFKGSSYQQSCDTSLQAYVIQN
jgi:hypothetical protein